ncbi:bacteriohemerythrin [Noviherbaspirillum saxi]|nr:hemerythrin domain-containing protein [Noviherbaspirillum saxi]
MNAATVAEIDFPWTDQYLLGFSPMDAHHREFVDTLNALATAAQDDVLTMLDKFIEATEEHFHQENDWMVKHAFPPRDCHMAEHQAVLRTLYEARGMVVMGRTDFLLGMIKALTEWFPGHADHLDSALAQWMTKKTHGGIPVVLKRLAREQTAE